MTEDQLKDSFPTLYQVHQFLLHAETLGYGQMEFTITVHNYQAKTVEMKAVEPQKEGAAKSITKKLVIAKRK